MHLEPFDLEYLKYVPVLPFSPRNCQEQQSIHNHALLSPFHHKPSQAQHLLGKPFSLDIFLFSHFLLSVLSFSYDPSHNHLFDNLFPCTFFFLCLFVLNLYDENGIWKWRRNASFFGKILIVIWILVF